MSFVALRVPLASQLRMSSPRSWALGLALGLFACGNPPDVAAECEIDDDCDSDQSCLLDIAGGYCTLPCTVDDDCPSRSACAVLIPGGELTCVKLCIDQADCHRDRDEDPEDFDLFCESVRESGLVFADPDREGRVCVP